MRRRHLGAGGDKCRALCAIRAQWHWADIDAGDCRLASAAHERFRRDTPRRDDTPHSLMLVSRQHATAHSRAIVGQGQCAPHKFFMR